MIDENIINEEIKKKKEAEMEELLEIIRLVAPGKKLRIALDDIAKGGLGALIVLGDSQKVLSIINGGIKIDCKFTPQRLVELCKMDGAIILSADRDKILYANTLIIPDNSIETSETGTRHIAAERAAKQTSVPIIAISQRRKSTTLYFKNMKYVLKNVEELLSKVAENLRMLEKHKEILTNLIINLNILEFSDLVTLQDVVLCIQRMELISKIADIIKKYVIELGAEGDIIRISLKEINQGLNEEKELLLKDYSRNWEFTKVILSTLTPDEIVDSDNIVRALLQNVSLADKIEARGYRILYKTSLSESIINRLIENFANFSELLISIDEGKTEKLNKVLEEKNIEKLIKELNLFREQSLSGKKI